MIALATMSILNDKIECFDQHICAILEHKWYELSKLFCHAAGWDLLFTAA